MAAAKPKADQASAQRFPPCPADSWTKALKKSQTLRIGGERQRPIDIIDAAKEEQPKVKVGILETVAVLHPNDKREIDSMCVMILGDGKNQHEMHRYNVVNVIMAL